MAERKPQEGQLVGIPIKLIDRNPKQPRQDFDEVDLRQLGSSIKTDGQAQPIIVVPHPEQGRDGCYIIVDGERRWRAAQLVGILELECVIRTEVGNLFEASFLTNLHRRDLNPIEEARAYETMIFEHDKIEVEVARLAGVSVATVRNRRKLLQLDPEVQNMVRSGKLPSGSALTLAQYASKGDQLRLAWAILEGRPIDKLPEGKKGKRLKRNPRQQISDIFELARRFRQHGPGVAAFLGVEKREQVVFWGGTPHATREKMPEQYREMADLANKVADLAETLNASTKARSSRKDRWDPHVDLTRKSQTTKPKVTPDEFQAAQGVLNMLFTNPRPLRVKLGLRDLAKALNAPGNTERARQQALGALRLAQYYWEKTSIGGDDGSAENAFILFLGRLKNDFGAPRTFQEFTERAGAEDRSFNPISFEPIFRSKETAKA